jgi:hypothetical protein
MVETAYLHYRTLLSQARLPSPDPTPQPSAQLKYRAEDVFELAFAGSQLAHFMLSSEMTECVVCGASGQNMSEADSHHPLCKVRRWWKAVDALKIGMEVQL